jgi:uncharacterized membrane protein HdeD (DUF308 family)
MARKKDPLFWGIVLIIVGAIFFLENFGFDVWDAVWKLWPLILIVWGVMKLAAGLKERREEPAERKDFPASQEKP